MTGPPRRSSTITSLQKNSLPFVTEESLSSAAGTWHNLGLIDFADMDAAPPAWAREADEWMRDRIVAGEHHELFEYPSAGGESASRAVPTLDHYLPMIYALALQEKGESIRFTCEGFQNGSISMRSFQIG